MSIAVAVLSAAAPLGGLPRLPERGLAVETKAGVQLQTMSGRPLAAVRGFDLAPDAFGRGLVLRKPDGRLFVLDRVRRRLVGFARPPMDPPGCRLTDGFRRLDLLICGSTLKTQRFGGPSRIVAAAPRGIGHWVRAEFAPDGSAILAQWSAECEVPVAYLVVRGRLRSYGAGSFALGWLPSGDAVIHFPNGPCAGTSGRARGIYAIPIGGKWRLLVATRRFAQYSMWGG